MDGSAVYDQSGKRVGTVDRVMIEKFSGRVAYAVMSFGRFFGVSTSEYAVPWRMLDYDPSWEDIVSSLRQSSFGVRRVSRVIAVRTGRIGRASRICKITIR